MYDEYAGKKLQLSILEKSNMSVIKASKKQGWVLKQRLQAGWARVRRARRLTTAKRGWAKIYYAGVSPSTSFGAAMWGVSDKHVQQQRLVTAVVGGLQQI